MDGAGHHPVYSIRSLVRALQYCGQQTPVYGFLRALVEGLSMTFCTVLVEESRKQMDGVLCGVRARYLRRTHTRTHTQHNPQL